MFDLKTLSVVAVETSVVDVVYPQTHNGNLKQAFFSALPHLTAEKMYSGIAEAPRAGDMVLLPADILDDACIEFARRLQLDTGDDPSHIRTILFGVPTFHAGGSLANTFDSMIYSKINNQAFYDGKFVCAVGSDPAGNHFKDSFNRHIACTQGGRQMVSHIIPVEDGNKRDRVMITAPSFTEPCDRHFRIDVLKKALTDARPSLIMVGGYLEYAGFLNSTADAINEYRRDPDQGYPNLAFTLAAQKIASGCDKSLFENNGQNIIHGNAGEFRRYMKQDDEWRLRFRQSFIDRDGNTLQGQAQEAAKNANIDYVNAKQAANDATSISAHQEVHTQGQHATTYVVTNGSRPSRTINRHGIHLLPNRPLSKENIVNTVGAGDNFVAGYWIGRALRYDESGCMEIAQEFSRAVIQQDEARLSRNKEYTSPRGLKFSGPIAHLEPSVLNNI